MDNSTVQTLKTIEASNHLSYMSHLCKKATGPL